MLILICSHRRSGTHWLIDVIRHNFPGVNKNFINIDRLMEEHKERISIYELEEMIGKEAGHLILKSHMTSDFTPFLEEKKNFIRDLIDRDGKIIYVYRDGRDVMVSLYFYMKRFTDNLPEFPDFMRMQNDFDQFYCKLNRVEYWKRHVWGWIDQKDSNVLKISYEKLYINFTECLNELSAFLNLQTNKKVKKIVFYNKKKRFDKIKYRLLHGEVKSSAILPRKGIVGDWKNHFSDSALEFFKDNAGDLMEKLGYY